MNSRFLLLLWMTISFIGSLTAQTATDSNEGLRITKDSSGDGLTLFWYGRTGRTYFVQQSPDLLQWKYLPIMDSGTGAPLSYGVSTTASRGFFRLSYTDDPLAGDPDGDFDGDGMSNMDELLNAQYGYDPFDFYNGQTPTLQLVSGGGQWGAPGEVLAQPIIVSVNSGASNAPVTFTVSSGGALLSQNGNLPWNSHLSVRTSAATGSGLVAAQAYGKLPATSSKVSTITITAGKATLQTTATTYDPTVPMPTALQAVPTSPTTVQLSWTAGDATRATSIEISRDDGANWQLYDVAEPGVSSFQITGLTPDVEVSFRVLTGDKRKAMMQGNASLGTWDWLKGYAGLWGAAWEWSNYSLLPHEVTAPTPEFLSDPTARVKTLPVSVPQLYVESVYRSDSRDGYQGFQDLNSVYLRWYQEETCSFGSGSLKNKEQSTTTFVWNPENYSQSSTSTGDPQVTTPDVEPTEEILSDTSRKETYKDNYWDYKFSVTLSNSYTLSTFITNVESWVPAFTGNRTLVQNNPLYPYYSQDNSAQASISLMLSPPWSDDTDSYAIKKLRYQWKVNSDENAVVVWDVRFTPADGSAVLHDLHSWVTHGDTESPVFEIDPTELNSKKNGTYQVGLVPLELAVDADRNGSILFDSSDETTATKPVRFWINNDHDTVEDDADHDQGYDADSVSDTIKTSRDLEDFLMMRLSIPSSLQEKVKSGECQVGLKMTNVSGGSPTIKVFNAYGSNEGNQILHAGEYYIWDQALASSLANGIYHTTFGTVGTSTVWVPVNSLFPTQYNQSGQTYLHPYLLFEGVTEGKGRLTLVLKINGQETETAGVWLDLVDIKKMYVRNTENQFVAPPEGMENKEAVTFVHGWNMSSAGSTVYAEILYKRLWHKGFKGRFAFFRWNTKFGGVFDDIPSVGEAVGSYLADFNGSENIAWNSGAALKQFVESLPPDYKSNLVAHSMGNIVAGSALAQGLQVKNYALLQAAVPASCYDDTENVHETKTYTQPIKIAGLNLWNKTMWTESGADNDYDPQAYRGKLKNIGSNNNLINFWQKDDHATSWAWEINNDLTKPSGFMTKEGYYYTSTNASGSRCVYVTGDETGVGHTQTTVTGYDALTYCCRAWSKAAGAQEKTQGAVSDKVDNTTLFGDVHSAEFIWRSQKLGDFYEDLMDQLKLKIKQ